MRIVAISLSSLLKNSKYIRVGDWYSLSTAQSVVVLWKLGKRIKQGKNMNDDTKLVRQIGKYTVKVIQSKCIAAASCVAISPDIFQLNEQNLVELIENGQDQEDNIMLAAQSCPTGAIEIYEGKVRVWPPL